MKVILAGATGSIGQEVLEQLVANAAITKICCITRNPLHLRAYPPDDKIRTVMIADFNHYSDHELAQLNAASACIWVLGPGPGVRRMDNLEEWKKIEVTYAKVLATAFATSPILVTQTSPLRFVYMSTSAAGMKRWAPEQCDKGLHQTTAMRIQHMTFKREAERELAHLEAAHPHRIQVTVARAPGTVESKLGYTNAHRAKNGCFAWKIVCVAIREDWLAASMVMDATNRNSGHRKLKADHMVSFGRQKCTANLPNETSPSGGRRWAYRLAPAYDGN